MALGKRKRCRLPGLKATFLWLLIATSVWILSMPSSMEGFIVANGDYSFTLPPPPSSPDTVSNNVTPHQGADRDANKTTGNIYHHPNFTVPFPLCLVHIGKAAGSTVSCGLGLTYADCEGMPRDKLPHTHFFHMRRNNCPDHTQTYVVTLRNPLHRLQSWFNFEKDIIPTRGASSQKMQDQIRKQRDLLFRDCYQTFYDFVTIGLRPLNHEIPSNTSHPQDMTCSERAWAAVLGVRAFSYHEWYNYEYYWTGLQRRGFPVTTVATTAASLQQPVLYALRLEHLQDDWNTITSKEPLFRPVNRKRPIPSNTTTNTSTTVHEPWDVVQPWNVTVMNSTNGSSNIDGSSSQSFLSQEALLQLCHALCSEIQVYKKFLQYSVNLNPSQRTESIQELNAFCPFPFVHKETNVHEPDTVDLTTFTPCPDIPTFPLMTVSGQQYRQEIKQRLYQKMAPKREGHKRKR